MKLGDRLDGHIVQGHVDQVGVVSAVIDLDEVATARQRIPSLSHDRPFARKENEGLAAE